MNKFYSTLLVSLLTFCAFSQNQETILRGAEAQKLISGAELVRLYPYTSIPAFIKYRSGSISESNAEKWLIGLLKMGDKAGVKLMRKEQDELGMTHYRYTQTYLGYEVFGSGYVVHCKNGFIISANGLMYDNITIPDSKIEETTALKLAMDKMGASVYKWQLPEEEEHAKHEFYVDKIRKSPTYFPKAELKIIPENGNFYTSNHAFRLSYVFDLYAHEPMDRKEIFVDVETGKINFENPLIMHGNANGTAVTAYSGTRSIKTDSVKVDSFRLREIGRGNGIQTFNLKKGTSIGSAVDFRDSNNYWNNVNANLDQYATDAHWGSEMTYDYFWLKHGRNSIDDAGFLLKSYIHYSTSYTNAFWNGSYMTYGDGASPYTPLVTMEIAGHEISHGLTTYTSNLTYSNESGALNESFSDIFGVAIDFFARPTLANWLMGDGIGGTPFRSMSNPNLYGDPDTYMGTNYYTGTADNGGVHTNSGVQNYWFYLLTNGGIGKNDKNDSFWVSGVGIDTAGKIAFRNNTYYLVASSQYADARFYAIQSAIDLYGGCSYPVKATTNAWYAVGVGAKYDSVVTADFSAISPTACNAPQTIKFINLSNNGVSFKWKFGNGDSSTMANPSYMYNANGTYTVTLIADGGLCGIDTIVKTNYISVDPHNDCIAYMTDGSSNQCNGILYDDGGPLNSYNTNDSLVFTVSPTGASAILFTKNDFDVEAGTANGVCDYDFVQFFNGATIGSTLIGKYCNTNLPPATISTGSSGTIKMISDPAATGRGIEFKWQCTIPGSKPSVRFSASTFNTCNGIVSFKDESYHSPTSWNWSFGDGGTSTAQNPTYTYNTSGVYHVRLIATNASGSDTFSKLSYITVSRITPPTATSQIRCGNGTLNLTATGSNTLQWFDSLNSTTVLGTGGTYTTPVLSANRSYFVQSTSINANKTYGPADTNIGTGGFHTAIPPAYMIFDATKPCKLISVKVRANSTKPRRIQLLDKFDNVIKDTVITINTGTQTVTLNFNIPMGQDLRLGIHKDSSAGLYRNTSGTSYPYTDASGLISIKGHNYSSSAPANYYYFYNWIVKEDDCTSPRTQVNVQIKNPITLKNLDTFNCNSSTITLTPSGNDIDSIYWTTGSIAASSRTVSPTTTTNYIYTAFNFCGAFKDTVTITALKTPTLNVSNDTSICLGQSARLRAFSNINVYWSSIPTTDTMPTVSPTVATLYPIIATNLCGTVRDTVSVSVVANPSVVARTDTSICSGYTIALTANSTSTITWYPMGTTGASVNVSPTTNSSYYAEVSNACGTKRDTVNISINPLPTLVKSNDTTICLGQSAKLKAKSNGTLLWPVLGLSDTLVTVSPTISTSYVVKATNSCGFLYDSVKVTVLNPPTVIARNDTAICSGTSTILSANSSSPITWYPINVNGSTTTVSPTTNTMYYAQVSNSCGTKRDTVNITVIYKPTLTANNDTSICSGKPILLKANTNGVLAWTNPVSTIPQITVIPTSTTKYTLKSSNVCGTVYDTINVSVLPSPKALSTKTITNLTVKYVNTSTNATSYKWIFGDNTISSVASPTKIYAASGTYNVLQIASNSCGSDTLKFTVTVTGTSGISNIAEKLISIYPNPTNEFLNIDLSQLKSQKDLTISIYDILGKKVLEDHSHGKDIKTLQISHLAKGTYQLRIMNDENDFMEKIVVE